jgi:hypothetical protein
MKRRNQEDILGHKYTRKNIEEKAKKEQEDKRKVK